MAAEAKEGEPSVLILGGSGFIGRNLVKFLVDNKLAGKIRVADKTIPAVAGMNAAHTAAFADKAKVEFKQADLTKDPHVAKAFEGNWDFVVNCCGETRFGMAEAEYKSKCVLSAEKCAAAAAKAGVKKWIEISTAQVYKAEKKKSDEKGKVDPWTTIAKFRLAAEAAVQATKVPLVTLRPAFVYGSGDQSSLMPRITTGASYIVLKEKMKMLWDKELKLNCVHVDDVCTAIWLGCTTLAAGSVWNLADDTDLDQGVLNDWIASMFGIEAGFAGAAINLAARAAMGQVAEVANDKHVPAWTKLCADHNIQNCPLSPYLDVEILKNNSLSVDGSAITKAGFKYSTPKVTEAILRGIVQEFIDNKQFPPVLKK